MNWSNVSFSVGGVRLDGITSIVLDEVRDTRPMAFSTSASFTVDAAGARALFDALMPRYRGASDATLAKRASYRGGRKSRRAWARLMARGFVGIGTFDGGRAFPLPPIRIVAAGGAE